MDGHAEALGYATEPRFFTVMQEIQPSPFKIHLVWNNIFLEMFSLYTWQGLLPLVGYTV